MLKRKEHRSGVFLQKSSSVDSMEEEKKIIHQTIGTVDLFLKYLVKIVEIGPPYQ